MAGGLGDRELRVKASEEGGATQGKGGRSREYPLG